MCELDASLCRQRVRTPTIIISETYEEKQKVCSSIHELERWFWRKAGMSETDYTYILAKRTKGTFYLPSIGFPLKEHLRAKKFNTNTNSGRAAKIYQENSLKIETNQMILHSLAFSVYLVSVRRKGTEKFLLENTSSMELKVWTGCIVLHRTSLKTKQNHTQKLWRKTKGIFLGTWSEKVVKCSEYESDEPYHYSRKWSQCYALVSVISANWVSVARIERH